MSLDAMSARHEEGIALFNKASAFSPAFGMIGTLVGLVNMLKGMNLDEGEPETSALPWRRH